MPATAKKKASNGAKKKASSTAKKAVTGTIERAEYLTPLEFATLFKIGRSTVQSMIESGALKTDRLPTADPNAKKQIRRIPWSEVERIRKAS